MGDFVSFYATHGPMSQLPDDVGAQDIPRYENDEKLRVPDRITTMVDGRVVEAEVAV